MQGCPQRRCVITMFPVNYIFVANLQTPVPIREFNVFVSKIMMVMINNAVVSHACVYECALEKESSESQKGFVIYTYYNKNF